MGKGGYGQRKGDPIQEESDADDRDNQMTELTRIE